MAESTDARTVLAYIERLDGARGFKVVFKNLELNHDSKLKQIERMNHGIEQVVRRLPEQYLWSYKRFRTRPNAEPDYYQFDEHPLRTKLRKQLLSLLLKIASYPGLGILRQSAIYARTVRPIFFRRRMKITSVNLRLCGQDESELGDSSLLEFLKTGMETGKIWHSSNETFASFFTEPEGSGDLSNVDNGVLILTPPLGNREVLMRYLGTRYQTTEYYHPNSHAELDELIVNQRHRSGINPVQHNHTGRTVIVDELKSGHVATLCPDQQPRLRGGIFVPFFDEPALTSLAIAEILRESRARLFFGYAIRTDSGFKIGFEECPYHNDQTDKEILALVNGQLEEVIQRSPEQYRWSDKRFNIRPAGEVKVYR